MEPKDLLKIQKLANHSALHGTLLLFPFQPLRSTHWFDIIFDVPKDWANEEIHFIWDCECEALLWSPDGTPLQAFLGSAGEDRRSEYILDCKPGESLHLYVEMACTAMFGNGTGNGWGGLGPTPTDLDKKFKLKEAHIATFDRLAYDLLIEFTLIKDMAEVNSLKIRQFTYLAFTCRFCSCLSSIDYRQQDYECIPN